MDWRERIWGDWWGPDTPWVFQRSKWFKKTQRSSKAITIWVTFLSLLWRCSWTLQKYIFRVSFLICKSGLGRRSVGVGNHSAVSQARLKHLAHLSSAPTSYFEDWIQAAESQPKSICWFSALPKSVNHRKDNAAVLNWESMLFVTGTCPCK